MARSIRRAAYLWAILFVGWTLYIAYHMKSSEMTLENKTKFVWDENQDFDHNLERYLEFREQARLWTLHNQTLLPNNQSSTPFQFFVYRRNYTGLGNRIIGLLNYFLLGMLTGRILLIDWSTPCPYAALFDDAHHFDCASWGTLCQANSSFSIGISNPLTNPTWNPTSDASTFHLVNSTHNHLDVFATDGRYVARFRNFLPLRTQISRTLARLLTLPQRRIKEKVADVVKKADLTLPGLSVHVRTVDLPPKKQIVFLNEKDLKRYLHRVNQTIAENVKKKGRVNLFLAMDDRELKVRWIDWLLGVWRNQLHIYSSPSDEAIIHFGKDCGDAVLVDLFLQCYGSVGIGTKASTFSQLISRVCHFSNYTIIKKKGRVFAKRKKELEQ